jgi:hypothetical protein
MASVTDFAARGKVIAAQPGKIVFQPSNTNYELHLLPAKGDYHGPQGTPVDLFVRVVARKVYTVPSGGNFIAPIFGPPKTIQGRVRHVEDGLIVVQAGLPVIVTLPKATDAIDLNDGPIALGEMVNVVSLPGGTFEPAVAAPESREPTLATRPA